MQITLTTIGRRSGRARAVTLYAWEHGDDLVVVGSQGGAPRDPAWVHNLRANPIAEVQRGRERVSLRAREVEGAERARQWAMVVDRFPLYATYQRRTARTIPLFVLGA